MNDWKIFGNTEWKFIAIDFMRTEGEGKDGDFAWDITQFQIYWKIKPKSALA